ncbi:hypothetical protein BDZ91DRAFT_719203 [Kalaharituber pfeilii]|nr:hypothetical protein BDZ91DRAFT_719203 [Kalaharituber pfeilii]
MPPYCLARHLNSTLIFELNSGEVYIHCILHQLIINIHRHTQVLNILLMLFLLLLL